MIKVFKVIQLVKLELVILNFRSKIELAIIFHPDIQQI
jgi:hypothetical protein